MTELQNNLNRIGGVVKTDRKNTMKVNSIDTREYTMLEYLLQTYGDDYFTKEDIENMCYCDDGSVWVGSIEFKTPYILD